MRLALIAAILAAPGLVACGGGGSEAQPETTARPTTAATTTEPVVEPLTAEERSWLEKITRIRPRIAKPFEQSRITITRATMRRFARVLRSCTAIRKAAGPASERFERAERLVKRACAKYDAGARQFERAIAVSDEGGSVVVGTPEEKIFDKALDRAFAAQSNGDNLMTRAEDKAKEIEAEILAAS